MDATYDRELIAEMLAAAAHGGIHLFAMDAVMGQIAALRAADNRDAAGVGVPSAETIASALWRDWMTNDQADALGRDMHKWLTAHATIPTVAPAGEAVVIGYRPMEGKATISWHGSSNPDWVKLGAKLYTHPPAAEVREVDAVRAALELFVRHAEEVDLGHGDGVVTTCESLAAAKAALVRPQPGEVSGG